MAKGKASKDEVNKSEEIRNLIRANPKIQTREIIDQLGQRGIVVKSPLVYLIRGKMKKQKRRAVREKVVQTGAANPVKLVLTIRSLAHEAGGIANLKKIVDAMAE